MKIYINKQTRQVNFRNKVIGNDGENLQDIFEFEFDDEFVDGTARLEYEIDGNKYYAMLSKIDQIYTIPIKSVITKVGRIQMQVVITESEEDEGIPIFKSNVFYLYCDESINAQIEEPEEYVEWIDVANARLSEIDDAINETNNLNLDANRVENGVKVIITKKDGEQKEVIVADGERGEDGPQGPQGEPGPSYDDTEIRTLLNLKVPKTTKINNKELSEDIELTPSDIGIGSVFTLKGSVATVSDLPSTGNVVGDVYYVEAEEVGYIWLEKQSILQWEQLGLPIDLSNYVEKDQVKVIELEGDSGTLTNDEFNIIIENTKNIALLNDNQIYYLYEMNDTYYTFTNISSPLIDVVNYTSILINVSEEAVNYKTWTKEESIPQATKEYVDDLVGDIDTLLQDINSGGGVE